MFKFILFVIFLSTAAAAALQINDTRLPNQAESFGQFLDGLRINAIQKGISETTLNRAFAGLLPDAKVIEYDRNQAEFTLNFWRYINSRVSDNRLQKGVDKLQENQDLLGNAYEKYGVNPEVLVAFWGLETNYGKNVGTMNLVRSLATLSFDERRREFFTKELLILLKLIDEGKLALDVEGSWAGAMGNLQFMPSNVDAYAIDKDGDGVLDLWNSKDDIFFTGANFLQNIGWKRDERWGDEVKLAADFDFSLANIKQKKSVAEWQNLGVIRADGKEFLQAKQPAALILPMGYQGPAFLVYANFYAILRWNRSLLYALSVGYLSDRLAQKPLLVAKAIAEPSLSRFDVQTIQQTLNQMGFDVGKADGIAGPKTRNAVRDYQRENALPIDGYVGYQLFKNLQGQ
ncbi:MAG: lytic murein transglycosylase [Candidatus Thioglobus sp.]|nr:MAG: lytic murein transglycosylase [Candidatus Thioglobus sp.]